MRFLFLEFVAVLRDMCVALSDAITGRGARRYEHTLVVRAPREMVWAVASARNITLDGSPPIVIRALPSPQPGVEALEMRTGTQSSRIGRRVLARSEGVGEICELVAEHTDSGIMDAGATTWGYALADAPDGTRLTIFREGARFKLGARLNTPRAVRLMARRIASASEEAAAMRRNRLRKAA